MINMIRKITASALYIALISLLATGTQDVVAGANSKTGNSTRGSILWSENCARCHNMRSPSDLSSEQWITSVYHMRIRAGLTGQEARDILAFLQGSTTQAAQPTAKPAVKPSMESTRSGKDIYNVACAGCHGDKGNGNLPGVPDLTDSKGRLTKSDDVLLGNIVSGLQTPGNLMAMPAKGGNAGLTVEELGDVLSYLRSLTGVKPHG